MGRGDSTVVKRDENDQCTLYYTSIKLPKNFQDFKRRKRKRQGIGIVVYTIQWYITQGFGRWIQGREPNVTLSYIASWSLGWAT